MKRLLTLVALTCAAVTSFGATLNPIQLLNPAGSTSGQAIVSTGASTAPAWGNVTATALGPQAANTVVGNATGSSASPTAITVTGCNGAAQALQWTNGSGFGCNSAIATSGANSNITSLTGLVSLTASGTITPSQTSGIVGTTTNNNANAGSVGEFISSTVAIGSAVSLTNNVPANVTSISLTAGDWDVFGNVAFTTNTSTAVSYIQGAISTTSATASVANSFQHPGLPTGNNSSAGTCPSQRLSLSGTTTVFLVAVSGFSTSTQAAYGFIGARRRR